MKSYITFVLSAVFFSTAVMGQSNAISRYFSEYENREDLTTIILSGKAFELAQEMETDDEDLKKYKELASEITGLTMIVDDHDPKAPTTAANAVKRVSAHFEELITVKEKDMHIKMMIDEMGGTVNEFLMIVGADSNFVLVSLTGKMKLSDLGVLTQQLAKVGSQAFSQMSAVTSEVKIYPNPVRSGQELTIELSSDSKPTEMRIFNSSGVQVQVFNAKPGKNSIRLGNLNSGVYVVKSSSGEKEMVSKFVIQ